MPAQHCTRPRRVHSRPLCTRVRQLLSGTYAVGPRSLHCGGFGLLCACGALVGLAAAHTCSRPLLYLVRRSPHAHRALIPRLLPFTHAYTPLGAWATCTLLVTSNPNPPSPVALALAPTLPQHACTSLVAAGGAAQLLGTVSRLLSSDRLRISPSSAASILHFRGSSGGAAPALMWHGQHSSHRLLLGFGGVTVLICLVAVRPANYHAIPRYTPPTVLACLVTYIVTYAYGRYWRR